MTRTDVQPEWRALWERYGRVEDQPPEMFLEWIHPHGPEAFQGKRVLDAGCGGGQHASFVARFARELVGVDRSTGDLVRERLAPFPNVTVHQGDIARIRPEELGGPFDVVYSIGVIHHTDDPDATFANLVRCLKPGGLIIAWVYSLEGNRVARWGVEPARKLLLRHLSQPLLHGLSWGLTVPALAAAHTVYRLPGARGVLPMASYLRYQRELPPWRVAMNVLDKLVAPHTDFISRERAERWLRDPLLEPVHFSRFLDVSWRLSARRRG